MRQKVSADRLARFMKLIGRGEKKKGRVYFVGGATAVLLGWRETTIDVDLKLVPELDEILKRLPQLKEDLQLNVKLASPDDFVPALPGWEDRVEDKLYKYPAIDAKSLREAVEDLAKGQ